MLEIYANKFFIVNQLIMLIAKTFFFPGPECLSRIGRGSRLGAQGKGAPTVRRKRAHASTGEDVGDIYNGTAPTFCLGDAFIRKGGSLFQTLDKMEQPLLSV